MNILPITLTPEEAVRIGENTTLTEANICKDIYREFCRKNEEVKKHLDYINFLFLLATVWNAGRIEGIRAERTKQRNKRFNYSCCCTPPREQPKKIPVYNIPMMSDFKWQYDCLISRLEHPEYYTDAGEDVNQTIERLKAWLKEHEAIGLTEEELQILNDIIR